MNECQIWYWKSIHESHMSNEDCKKDFVPCSNCPINYHLCCIGKVSKGWLEGVFGHCSEYHQILAKHKEQMCSFKKDCNETIYTFSNMNQFLNLIH